jgi:hypothetical protein
MRRSYFNAFGVPTSSKVGSGAVLQLRNRGTKFRRNFVSPRAVFTKAVSALPVRFALRMVWAGVFSSLLSADDMDEVSTFLTSGDTSRKLTVWPHRTGNPPREMLPHHG